ncbi:MAG: hypothetical protein PHI01_03365, partial [Candidatus Izemoplasmatales bacterium]|nr:hypothetical protein [Candidatus Izemoplasmatales bacterium]
AMVIDMSAPEWTSSWHVARKYSSLASLGGTNETKYLAFYLTNNTNKTTASAWLYWTGNQNSYAMQLPETGETGWVFVDISKSGKTVSEIIDFGIGFNFSSSDPYTGSVIVYEIALVDSVPKLLESVNPAPHVMLDNFTYVDEEAFEANWTQRTNGANLNPGANMNLDVDNNAMILDMAAPTWTGSWHLARKYSSLASLGGSAETKYLAMYVTNDLNKRFGSIWVYWDGGGYKGTAVPLPRTGESGWIYIDVTAASSGKTVSQITDFALGFEYSSSKPYTGSITVHAIVLVADPEYLPHIDLEPGEVAPVNAAPVVSISDTGLAALSGMMLEAGQDLTSLEATLLSQITITDAEDGEITPLASMIDYKGLNLSSPEMGSYSIEVKTVDSESLESNVLVIPISIVSVFEDFEEFTDDADFKANWSRIETFRVAGGSWGTTAATLTTVGENNVLEFTYGPSTNGIKFDVTKAELDTLGAEYIGIYVKTSAEITGSSRFQAFHYVRGTYIELTCYGDFDYVDEGTYFYVKVADLPTDLTHISLMINLASDNTGTMTMDNIVIK